jgi:hypothetical protein
MIASQAGSREARLKDEREVNGMAFIFRCRE